MMPRYLLGLVLFAFLSNEVCSQNTYREVTLMDLMKKKKTGDPNMVIVDVRSRGEYGDSSQGKSGNIGRIKGAINIPLQELSRDSTAIHRFDAYKDKEIYLICSHSYRSRTVSNMLLRNGFTRVNNTRGGMTEWYRRSNEMAPYRDELDDHDVNYKLLSPHELLNDLDNGKRPLFVAISNTPKFWWDSASVRFYQYFPQFRNAVYFNYSDSLRLLQQVEKNKDREIVLYNIVNSGAAELAEWLTRKGYKAYYLVGGLNLFFENAADQNNPTKTDRYFTWQNDLRILTPRMYCSFASNKNMQLVDIRRDSLYNKVNQGVKHDYKHIQHSTNFFAGRGVDEFEKVFPAKDKEYVLINEFGSNGMDLAVALTKKGYKVSWLLGGYDRWEWFMNNAEDFGCNDMLE